MSKVMATSGNNMPIIKGSTGGSNVAAEGPATDLFAALFGGMQQSEIDNDENVVQTKSSGAEPVQSIDPHLAALLKAMGYPGFGEKRTELQKSDELQADGLEQDTDRLADAGLLAANGQEPKTNHRRSGQTIQQGLSKMAALADDLKQNQAKSSVTQTAQTQQLSDLDEGFIGPPPPRAIQKLASAGPDQSKNYSKTDIIVSRQPIRLPTEALQRPVLKTQAQDSVPLGDFVDGLADTELINAVSLKANRLLSLTPRLGDRSDSVAGSSSQLTASTVSYAQTGISAVGQQVNSAQTPGQQSGSAFAGIASTDLTEQWLDVLDVQDEKWTEQLVRRIDREFRMGGKGLELEINPRNLGRLKVSLSVAQDQTNVVLRTETGAAAQMLTEAESRLAQMLDEVGLKLGQFDAFTGGQNRNFEQQDSHKEQNDTAGEAENGSQTGDTDISDGLVNLKA